MTQFYNEYSKVLVSVDCIIFGFDGSNLQVLIGKRKMDPGRGEWSLYGGFVGATENLEDAANRVILELTGMKNLYIRQVGAFGRIDRDPGERVISIAYCALINVKDYDDSLRVEHGLEWVSLTDTPPHQSCAIKLQTPPRPLYADTASACIRGSNRRRD